MQPARDPVTTEQLLAEGRALRALAHGLLGDDGDDALQESFASALARPEAARRLGPWLAGTVRRLAARWRRDGAHRRARELAAARDDVDASSDPARIAAAAEAAAAVANAVRALDEPFRSAIVLRFWRGLSPEQMAVELGVPRNTVRSRLQRGLERLRARLDATYGARARWRGMLVGFAREEEAAIAGATGGGTLLALGVAMKFKLIVAATALLAAAFTVSWLLDGPPAPARTQPATAAPAAVATADPSRDEVTPPAAERTVFMPSADASTGAAGTSQEAAPAPVSKWLALFHVEDEQGRAIDGATVMVDDAERKAPATRARGEGSAAQPADAPLFELRTDANGDASATVDRESVIARASKGELRSGQMAVWRPIGSNVVVKLTVAMPVFLPGRVVRSDGLPGAHAVVKASVRGRGPRARGEAIEPAPVTADARGAFAIPVSEHASYEVYASLGDEHTFVEEVFITSRTPPEVVLAFRGGISIRGLVVDAAGAPVAEARVKVFRERDGANLRSRGETAGATTDAQGRFVVSVRKHAAFDVVAAADGHANSTLQRVETTAVHPHAEVRLTVPRLATISGTVRRADGSPFTGVLVFAWLEGWNEEPVGQPGIADRFAGPRGMTTGSDGRFSLAVDPGTAWHVTARPFAQNSWIEVITRKVAPGTKDLAITIGDDVLATCVVRGQVVTAADAVPVTAFELALVPVGDDGKAGNAESVRVAIDGSRFELTPLPLGRTFAVDVRPLDADKPVKSRPSLLLAPVRVGPFVTVASGIELDVRVPAWGELPVRVLGPDGAPARGVEVGVSRTPRLGLGFMIQRARRVDAEGRVTMKMCAPGPHALVVSRDAERLHREEVLVAAGLNAEVVVRLPK